jgi:hypothetical protein
MSRKVTEATKKRIAGRQRFKCANRPGSNLKGLKDFDCPYWMISGENQGLFDESGYEIDHIEEHCISKNDDEKNLQALCKICHSIKTKRFLMYRNKKINYESDGESDGESDEESDEESDDDSDGESDDKSDDKFEEKDNQISYEYDEDGDIIKYICNKCDYNTAIKTNFTRHLKRKNNCLKNNEHICKCGTIFNRRDNLVRHTKICKKMINKKKIKKMKITIELNK